MEESNVKRRGRLGQWATWLKRYSPFGFETLHEVPWPTWGLVFAVLFFCLIWKGYERAFDGTSTLSGGIGHFIYTVRTKKAALPEVLICGSSISGLGVDKVLLETNLKMPVGKATVDDCWLWEADRILKKYGEETRNVKIVLIDFHCSWLGSAPYEWRFQNGNTFHVFKDITDLSRRNLSFVDKLSNNKQITNRSPFFLPMKVTLGGLFRTFVHPPAVDGHERLWASPYYVEAQKSTQKKMREAAQASSSDQTFHLNKYSDEMEAAVWDFVAYCQSRNIFVVFNIPPTWHRHPVIKPEGKKLTKADRRFLDLCQALEGTPNCAVTFLRTFHEIVPEIDDADVLFDQYHLTKNGAAIYTNWLADQMRKNPKINAALQSPRKPEKFFVKKYANDFLQPVAKWLPKSLVP